MHYCQVCVDPTPMEPRSHFAVCPLCGHREPARRQPLLVVTGASGSGKSTLLHSVARELAGVAAVFDIDWLIDPFVMQAAERRSAGRRFGRPGSQWLLAWPRVGYRPSCSARWRRFTLRSFPRPIGSRPSASSSWTVPTTSAVSGSRRGRRGGHGRSKSRQGGRRGCASTSLTASTPGGRQSRTPRDRLRRGPGR